MPNFEVFDARIASALNRIIHNSHFNRRVSREEQKALKEDRFLRGRQIAYLIYEFFRVTGSQRFCRELCRPIHYQSSKWWYSGIRLEVGRNFIINDEKSHLMISWRIVQIKNTRVWKTQDRIGIVWHGDSSDEKGPDHHRLKTMVKRSIEQDLRNRILAPEMEIMRRTPWLRIREQNSVYKEIFEIVGSEKPTGSVLKKTSVVSVTMLISLISLRILSCSRMREMRREPEVPEEKAPVVECLDGPAKDYLKGTCTNLFCKKWHLPEKLVL